MTGPGSQKLRYSTSFVPGKTAAAKSYRPHHLDPSFNYFYGPRTIFSVGEDCYFDFYSVDSMSSPQRGTKVAPPPTPRPSLSLGPRELLSFSKTRKNNQHMYTPSLPPPLESSSSQNTSAVEWTDPLRVSPRYSRNEPSPTSMSGRRPSVRRRTSTRAKGSFSARNSPVPEAQAQVRPSISPAPRQFSPRASIRPSLMKRLTRRLHTPRPSEDNDDDDDPASLPIQRVPSTRRRSIRPSPSYRSSRRVSARSAQRLPSARLSRAPSSIGGQGLVPSSQSSSVLLGAIGSAALENDMDYSTDSELEEQPITMRSPRLERARATIAPNSRPVHLMPMPRIPSRDSVAELIKEITGRLEDGRASRDTLSSAWDFSLNDYCAAFPAPPTPGAAPRAISSTSVDYIVDDYQPSPSPLLASPVVAVVEPPITMPLSRPPPSLRTPLSNPSLGASNAELKLELTLRTSASWDNWSAWPSVSTPAKKGSSTTRVVTRPNTCESQVVVTPAEKHRSLTPTTQWEEPLSIKSSEPASPTTPATPPFVRSRSIDPLSQARRRTRVVCGQVFDDEEFADEVADGTIDYFNGPIPGQEDTLSSVNRRGSNKSSLLSSSTHPRLHTPAPSASTLSGYNAYSLNSPSDDGESMDVGVALTTEYREQATPSPISFSEQEDMRLTLYARRKGRKPDSFVPNPPLRVSPPPLRTTPPRHPPTSISSIQSVEKPLPIGGNAYGGAIDPRTQNEFATGRVTPVQPPPKTAPPKRKSFFRYPFGSKRSAGSLKLTNRPSNGQGAPPPASPRAKDPPISATANKVGFSPQQVTFLQRQPTVPIPPPPSSHAIRYLNPTSKFISFSRPSSSRGKAAALPT